MNVLVTGGSGFIGANLCERLLRDGHDVAVIDDLSTGSRANLEGLTIDLHVGDIRDRKALEVAAEGAEAIVHLAARGSVPKSVAEPLETNDVNVNGTLNVLSVARDLSAHVLFSSSSSVYGANRELPKRELMRPEPMSPYAASKLAGESYSLAFQHVYGLDVLVFRFFNVYGPLQSAGHAYAAVIPSFVDALLHDKPIRVFGDGKQSRDFTSVTSVVDVLSRALLDRVIAARPVNLAFNTRTTLLELITELEDIIGRRGVVEFQPPRPGDVVASQADPAALLELFPGVSPLPLRDGLEATVAWFRSRQAS